MKNTVSYIIGSLTLGIFLLNCSGEDKDNFTPDPLSTASPGMVTLVFPPDNSDCLSGSDVSSAESTIIFDWNDAGNTNSYRLTVKNLETQTMENYTTTHSNKMVTVLKDTPYSWFVVSMNNTDQTATSSIWNFKTAGIAVSSYVPYPAEPVFPASFTKLGSSTTTVLLEWIVQDPEADIKETEVFFDVVSPPGIKGTVTGSSSLSVNVSSGNIYYWSVVTKDHNGNSSESQIFQFSVE